MWNLYKNVWYVQRSMFIVNRKIFVNELNISLPLWAWVKKKKTVHGMETLWISSKEKVLSAVISKGGHADSFLGYEWTWHDWFSWKIWNCKLCFLLPNSYIKFTLFIVWTSHTHTHTHTTPLHEQEVTQVQFFKQFNRFEFKVFFLLDQFPYQG